MKGRKQTMKLLLIFSWLSSIIHSAPTVNSECRDFSDVILTEILGAAYNTRYMSINEPIQRDYYLRDIAESSGSDLKRDSPSITPSFYVEDDYASELSDEPAWIVKHSGINLKHQSFKLGKERSRRNTRYKKQWECESRIKWIDLGPDYFPRYLRSVECTSKYCWYGHYKCKPRSFTVKILKRRRDKCIDVRNGSIISKDSSPLDVNYFKSNSDQDDTVLQTSQGKLNFLHLD